MAANRAPSKSWFSGGVGRSARAAIVLLGAYLFVVNAGGLYLVRATARAEERNLDQYLGVLGRSLVEPPRDYFAILQFLTDPSTGGIDEDALADYSNSTDWRNLSDALRGVANESFITSAELLTPAGVVIQTSRNEELTDAERERHRDEDRESIAAAAAGVASSPRLTSIDMAKRQYLPVRTTAGTVVAVLRLEVNPQPFRTLKRLRDRLFLGFAGSGVLLGLLWWSTVRLTRRAIEAERAASRADRLRSLGTMTAGIAHELRNPLNILLLQIEEMRSIAAGLCDDPARGELAQTAADMKTEADRLKALTEQFLAFSRSSAEQSFEVRLVRAGDVAAETFRWWSKGLDPRLRTATLENNAGDVRVFFAEDPLKQVLMNLLRNADEAIGAQPGEVSLSLERRGPFVEIAVADSGPGIATEIAEHIFDPFFTTRAEGTGLGLSISRALAESAGGSLMVEPSSRGARFVLRLRCQS